MSTTNPEIPRLFDRIKKQAAASVGIVRNENHNPQFVTKHLAQQYTDRIITGIELCLKTYKQFLSKPNPIIDEMYALKVDLEEFRKTL